MKEYIAEYIVPVEKKGNDCMFDFMNAKRLIRCKDCKYWLPQHQFGFDSDNDEYHDYCAKHIPEDDYYAFEKNANDYCSWAEPKETT